MILWLLFLHHLADVALQPSWLIESKKKHLWAIYEHVVIYAGVLSLGLWWLQVFQPWMFLYFLIGHFVIDSFFYRVLPRVRNEEKQYWYVYPDQFFHYLQILILVIVL